MGQTGIAEMDMGVYDSWKQQMLFRIDGLGAVEKRLIRLSTAHRGNKFTVNDNISQIRFAFVDNRGVVDQYFPLIHFYGDIF